MHRITFCSGCRQAFLILSCILLLTSVACSTSEDKFVKHLKSGEQSLEDGSLKEAEIALRNALQIKQDNAEANFLLAEIMMQQGEPGQAYQYYQRTLDADPEHIQARLRLAVILSLGNRQEQALARR